MKKSTVFLFGAGSTIAWKSPSTDELTKIIIDCGFRTKDNSKFITQLIYDQLIDVVKDKKLINFETILSVIDELSIFYSRFSKFNYNHSLLKVLYDLKFSDEVLNFEITNQDYLNTWIKIPGYIDEKKGIYTGNQTAEQFFFNSLINVLISQISNRISEYSWHTDGYSAIPDVKSTELFQNWILDIHKDSSIRMYSLNYESIFKILLEKKRIQFFDGFSDLILVDNFGHIAPPDIVKILMDNESNIFYNLHGSAYWRIIDEKLYKTDHPYIQLNDRDVVTVEIEKGRSLMLTNIITGYNKIHRGYITPFRQMQLRFDMDCLTADEIYIIGYSLGDKHINQSIKASILYNEKVKIHIVDPQVESGDMYNVIINDIAGDVTKYFHGATPIRYKNYETSVIYFDKIITHPLTMEEFLSTISENSV